MEWLVLVVLVLLAAVLIGLPRYASTDRAARFEQEQAALMEERRLLLAELRELDEDAAAGRISNEDRLAGRRAVAPRLRAVTEILHAAGVDTSLTR